MPKFKITDPDTGRSLIVSGDGPPTDQEAADLFAQTKAAKPQKSDAIADTEKIVGLGARGLSDSVLETVGAIPDAVAWGFRKVGLPAPKEAGYYTAGLKKGYNALGSALAAPIRALGVPDTALPDKPETTAQKLAYGGGHGFGDALTIALPAAGVAKAAKEGTVVNNVAKALAAQPIAQAAAGAAGGAVGEATDSPALGILAALGTAGGAEGVRSQASKLFKPNLSELTDAAPKDARAAAKYVSKVVAAAKKSPDDLIRGDAASAGKPVTAAEAVGRPGIGALAALGRRAGTTPDALEGLLSARAEGAPNRMLADFAETLGISPEAAKGNIEAFIEGKQADASPLYKQAYAANKSISSPTLDRLLMTPAGKKAMSQAVETMQNKGSHVGVPDPDLLEQAADSGQIIPWKGGVASGLKLETYDKIKKALGDMYNGASAPLTGGLGSDVASGILDLKNKLIKELDRLDVTAQAGPNSLKPEGGMYAQARRAAGDYLDAKKQYDAGQKILFDQKVGVDQLMASVAEMSEPSLQAFKGGVANKIFAMAQNGRLRPNALNTPAVRGKLAALFGQDNADAFIQRAQAEAKMAQTGSRMKPGIGSPTAELQDAIGDQDSPVNLKNATDVAVVGAHALQGNVLPALARLGQVAGDTIFHPRRAVMPVGTRDEAGRLLMMAPDQLGQYLADVTAANKSALPNMLQTPLLTKDMVAALLMGRGKDALLSPQN
jgi:hypothetical protein